LDIDLPHGYKSPDFGIKETQIRVAGS